MAGSSAPHRRLPLAGLSLVVAAACGGATTNTVTVRIVNGAAVFGAWPVSFGVATGNSAAAFSIYVTLQ